MASDKLLTCDRSVKVRQKNLTCSIPIGTNYTEIHTLFEPYFSYSLDFI